MIRITLILFLLAIAVPASVLAHPFTDTTVPEQFSNAPEGTDRVIVTYSEAIEIDFSSLKVYDSGGLQIDQRNTAYYDGINSLVVNTKPLGEGVYTVTSKVLSRVDGHLVNYAFVFAVGGATIDPTLLDDKSNTELIYYPEAVAIIPGYIGQTMILGGVIMSFFVWGLYKRKIDDTDLIEKYRGKLMSFTGAGLIAVLASDIFVLAVHSFRLEAGVLDSLQTTFGATWILRFSITVIMLGLWFVTEKKKIFSRKGFVPMLILSLILIATTTMTGHATASDNVAAMVLDYMHNLVAAVWIGGVIFLAYCLFPALIDSPKTAIASLPQFSVIFIVALGVVIVTGPSLLWLLEDDLNSVISSTYVLLIAIRIRESINIVQNLREKIFFFSVTNHKPNMITVMENLKIHVAPNVVCSESNTPASSLKLCTASTNMSEASTAIRPAPVNDMSFPRYFSIRSVSSIFLLYNPHTKNDMITPPSIIVCPMYPGIIATASG